MASALTHAFVTYAQCSKSSRKFTIAGVIPFCITRFNTLRVGILFLIKLLNHFELEMTMLTVEIKILFAPLMSTCMIDYIAWGYFISGNQSKLSVTTKIAINSPLGVIVSGNWIAYYWINICASISVIRLRTSPPMNILLRK